MVIVCVERNADGRIKSYSVRGHAGYQPRGWDIVCAAVSMLAQTAILGLNRYIEEGLAFLIDDDLGILKCSLPDGLDETAAVRADAILETMVMGLCNLQKNYFRHIRVFRRRWTS